MTNLAFSLGQREANSSLGAGEFAKLDELVTARSASGVVIVRGAVDALAALDRHIARRTRPTGRSILRVGSLPSDDVWRDLALRLGVSFTDVPSVATDLLKRLGTAVAVVLERSSTQWGRDLATEIAHRIALRDPADAPLIVVLTARAVDANDATLIDLDGPLSPDEVERWWNAIAVEMPLPGVARLEALEQWWTAAQFTPADARPTALELSGGAARLLARVALAHRVLPPAAIERLGSRDAFDELLRLRVLEADASGWIVDARLPLAETGGDAQDARAVAELLDALRDDAWASARASELYALCGMADAAEDALARAIRKSSDPAARSDFWRRWEASLAILNDATAGARLLRSAELALAVGDVDRALDFAHSAAARSGETFDAMLALGRATLARGDLTVAAVALRKAMDRAPDAAARARAVVELAEVEYNAGDLASARSLANDAIASGCDLATRLQARNVVGKLHLAAAAWEDAERHFAADACEAACGGDHIAELRARLNRAVAILSSRRYDEARSILTSILDEGERRGELHAMSFALINLAVIAIRRHDYAEALRMSEQAVEVSHRIGAKIRLGRVIVNVAELRLRLGLVAEAEQAIAFGRRALGSGMPGRLFTSFALTTALIHFARGRTLEAAAVLGEALSAAGGSGDGALVGACHRLAARIALEDGDIAAAEAAIANARHELSDAKARAEVSLLEAMRAQAAGESFGALAQDALDLARQAEDIELAREARVLMHHAALLDDDMAAAKAHLDAAVLIRDQIANGLSSDLRSRFLARRDVAVLGALAAGFDRSRQQASVPPPPPPTPLPDRGASPRTSAFVRMVGQDPAMIALTSAIRKVGATDATVLVHGESGTGKELVAEALHEASARRSGPLVKVNCAALVETLLLSELFGHEKGAFTGAAARRRGRFELAEGGTLFLDEIGDISPRTQVALLRVLQDRTFERVGGVTPLRANVRVVCATHRDLKAMVSRGEFREDLYYRLRGFVLEVPSLRQRIDDLPLIAQAILDRVGREQGRAPMRLSGRALKGLARHSWPGNVRELENALRAAAVFAEGDVIELEDLTSNIDVLRELCEANPPSLAPPEDAPGMRNAFGPPSMSPPTLRASIDAPGFDSVPPGARASGDGGDASGATDVAYATVRSGTSLGDLKRTIERECIARALAESKGNITRAAALLGMKRPRLSQLVKQYGFGGTSEAEDGE